MNAELTLYAGEIKTLIDKLTASLDGLDAEQLNWKPPVADANSIFVIVTHTLGNIRAWVLGICCGQPIDRDRPAEFASSGPNAAPLVERARELAREVEDALAGLDPSTLDDLREARQRLWGAGTAEPVTGRAAILHAIEHASEHLGHIGITKDLLARAGVSA